MQCRPRAASGEERKLASERPGLSGPGHGHQRRVLRPTEGGAMGDEMDTMIPEREMKVRDGPGPPSFPQLSRRCLGAPPNGEARVRLPRLPPELPAAFSSRQRALERSLWLPARQPRRMHCSRPILVLCAPVPLPWLLSRGGRSSASNYCLLSVYPRTRKSSPIE